MKIIRVLFSMFVVLIWGVCAQALTVNGPTLENNNASWQNNGISFTALRDTSIDSFVFQNQGLADTIRLTDTSSNILETYTTPAGDSSHFADVSWSLSAGKSYYLIAEQNNGDNGKWAFYYQYPTGNADINVTGWVRDIFSKDKSSGNTFWFHFNDITTSDTVNTVPEPSTISLLGLGLLAFAARKKLKKF